MSRLAGRSALLTEAGHGAGGRATVATGRARPELGTAILAQRPE